MSVGTYSRQTADSGELTLQFAHADLQRFKSFTELVPKALAAAQRRAINKTLRWLRTHIARSVSQQERIAQTAVRQRLRAYPVSGAGAGKLWFGINAISAGRIGRARQTRTGVSVAGRRYQGAFYKAVYGGTPDIWIRKGSKHFKASDYPESDVSIGVGSRTGWVSEGGNGSRFPLVKAMLSLEDVRPHFEAWSKRAHQRLLEVMEQELNYELQKYLQGSPRV